jgi:hypothetical protein
VPVRKKKHSGNYRYKRDVIIEGPVKKVKGWVCWWVLYLEVIKIDTAADEV